MLSPTASAGAQGPCKPIDRSGLGLGCHQNPSPSRYTPICAGASQSAKLNVNSPLYMSLTTGGVLAPSYQFQEEKNGEQPPGPCRGVHGLAPPLGSSPSTRGCPSHCHQNPKYGHSSILSTLTCLTEKQPRNLAQPRLPDVLHGPRGCQSVAVTGLRIVLSRNSQYRRNIFSSFLVKMERTE